LMDRLDVTLDTRPVDVHRLVALESKEPSSEWYRVRVEIARERQAHRFRDAPGIYCNAQMGPRLLWRHTRASPEARHMLEMAVTAFGLSARAHDRILKMARTRADLEDHAQISDEDMNFAVGCRVLDRATFHAGEPGVENRAR
jgi:magnesium chelatase family protein